MRPRAAVTPGDHPRSRGVYVKNGGERPVGQGSSPLARGLRRAHYRCRSHRRIIPARAGFTDSLSLGLGLAWDHPRSRGVYLRLPREEGSRPGSSPLARGLQTILSKGYPAPRIIPARAGFTLECRRGRGTPSDHPRSRGVYYAYDPRHIYPDGSSPLARGLRIGRVGPGLGRRIIPARAGFTQNDFRCTNNG